MSFFGGVRELNEVMTQQSGNAAFVVNEISNSLLGKVGGILALLGVVAAPITSGDTAFRSARLIVADFLKLNQSSFRNRFIICIPLFAAGLGLTFMDFGIVWRYFAWVNQTLATVVLWMVTAYLIQEKKFFWVSLVPAVFMSAVATAYILVAPEGFGLTTSIAYTAGILVAGLLFVLTLIKAYQIRHKQNPALETV
jgi:carbon starvation protein CstA